MEYGMIFWKFLPIIISFLTLAAHFYRADLFVLSFLSLLIPLSLAIKKSWIAKLLQLLLLAGFFEWLRTLWILADERYTRGEPWLRLTIILGIVAMFTLSSALIFKNNTVKEYFINSKV